MSTQGSASNLAAAARTLAVAWEQTKESWQDAKSREFEEKFLKELPSQVASALNAMNELELLIKKVKSDCE